MRLTIDANIVISALVKDGLCRKIVFDSLLQLNAPRFLLTELQKHRGLILRKSGLAEEAFDKLLCLVLGKILLVSSEELLQYMPAASKLVGDENDWFYLAAALCVGSDILSNDKGMKKQARVKVYSVEELASELGII